MLPPRHGPLACSRQPASWPSPCRPLLLHHGSRVAFGLSWLQVQLDNRGYSRGLRQRLYHISREQGWRERYGILVGE